MTKRKTTEEFKEQIRTLHRDRYILDNVVYVNNKTYVELICRKHGPFSMTPNCLLSGQNCPECAKEEVVKRKTLARENVINKIKAVHGGKYTFENFVYHGMLRKSTFTCPIHGDFKMTPAHLIEGHECQKCANENRSSKKRKKVEDFVREVNVVHHNKYNYEKVDYKNNREQITISCPTHGDFTQKALDHLQGKGCPKCGHIISKAEDEIYEHVCKLLNKDEVVQHNKSILDGHEIDIYIPSCKLGIEYNGLRWHSEEFGKDKNYHVSKTDTALSKGIHLIQIFEDEWLEHKDLVLEKIEHFIGKSECKVIGARKCKIEEIDKEEAKEFLDKFHIQGFTKSSLYYGAFYEGILIGVMSFTQESKGMWNLTRFSTDISCSYPGLANKIFKHFITEHNDDIIEVKTFLDRRWSHNTTNVYDRMGFTLTEITRPDYRYIVGNKRVHKFNFRKQRLHKTYGLPLSMTEYEMTKNLGFYRIWDCGLYKYVWKNQRK